MFLCITRDHFTFARLAKLADGTICRGRTSSARRRIRTDPGFARLVHSAFARFCASRGDRTLVCNADFPRCKRAIPIVTALRTARNAAALVIRSVARQFTLPLITARNRTVWIGRTRIAPRSACLHVVGPHAFACAIVALGIAHARMFGNVASFVFAAVWIRSAPRFARPRIEVAVIPFAASSIFAAVSHLVFAVAPNALLRRAAFVVAATAVVHRSIDIHTPRSASELTDRTTRGVAIPYGHHVFGGRWVWLATGAEQGTERANEKLFPCRVHTFSFCSVVSTQKRG